MTSKRFLSVALSTLGIGAAVILGTSYASNPYGLFGGRAEAARRRLSRGADDEVFALLQVHSDEFR